MSGEEVARRMRAIPPRVRDAVFAQQRENGETIAQAMRSAVTRRSGRLASTIRVETKPVDGGEAVFVKAGGGVTKKGALDYARFIEFGTKKMPAEPYFWPIVRLLRKSLRRKLNKVMKQASEKEFS